MRVFHGSDTWIERIDLTKGKTHPDFREELAINFSQAIIVP